jgi:hypothetical protein
MRKKADHNMLCPLFFLLKISEGKIGTANPLLSANVKRLDLAVFSALDVFGISYT